jgi:hypothetical protein
VCPSRLHRGPSRGRRSRGGSVPAPGSARGKTGPTARRRPARNRGNGGSSLASMPAN